MIRWSVLSLAVLLLACDSNADKAPGGSGAAQSNAASAKKEPVKSGDPAPAATSAAPTAAPSSSPSATPSSSPGAAPTAASATPVTPATLAAMFDGAPDGAIKLAAPTVLGKASIALPQGWDTRGGWDSVDHVGKPDRSVGIVLLRLDISEALLDANIATWVKVPFATTEVKWEPREAGKLGKARLDAKVARGSGKIGKDDADFWQVATGFDGKKYALVLIAGVKKSEPEATRAQMIAAMRSVEWK